MAKVLMNDLSNVRGEAAAIMREAVRMSDGLPGEVEQEPDPDLTLMWHTSDEVHAHKRTIDGPRWQSPNLTSKELRLASFNRHQVANGHEPIDSYTSNEERMRQFGVER